ncbi:MAG TPA: hypothetical protein VFV34_19840 [Blastocatellia bacterium]|nr:hypothetical protein [Blastocatellia bacterium]
MRELTKSIVSFSWAMSLFPIQQVINVLSPSKAAKSINNVTDAAKNELSGITEATFKTGDSLQRGVVDLTFSTLSPQVLDPNTWIRATSDVLRQTVGAMGHVMPGASSGSQSEGTGWGPMPPPSRSDGDR